MKSFLFFVAGLFVGGLPLGWVAMEQARQLDELDAVIAASMETLDDAEVTLKRVEQSVAGFDNALKDFLPELGDGDSQKFELPDGRFVLNGPGALKVCEKGMKPTDCEINTMDKLKVKSTRYGLWKKTIVK